MKTHCTIPLPPNPTIIDIKQCAQIFNVTPHALRISYYRNGIPHFKIGGQIKFVREVVEEWIRRKIKP